MSALEFRNLLEAGDVDALRAASARLMPQFPQSASRREAEIVMHHARTQCDAVTFSKRAYSHRWLADHNFPSGLPDHLKPKAERIYPKVVEAVGISCNSDHFPEAALAIRGAMEQAVLDAYAEGRTDPAFVAQRMAEARAKETQHLFGSLQRSS